MRSGVASSRAPAWRRWLPGWRADPLSPQRPAGLIPAALAETASGLVLEGEDGLVVLGDRPVNAETPAHLLADDVTPNRRHFIRDNGSMPEMARRMDASGWTLTVDGGVDNPLTLDDLKSRFKPVKLKLQLECGATASAAPAVIAAWLRNREWPCNHPRPGN